MEYRKLVLLIVLPALAACHEVAGPIEPPASFCDRPGACVVAGADLVVDTPRIVAWPRMRTDSATGLPVVLAGDRIAVEFRYFNRGDAASDSTKVYVCTNWVHSDDCKGRNPSETRIRRIAPGWSYVDTVQITVNGDLFWHREPEAGAVVVNMVSNESIIDFKNNDAWVPFHFGHGRVTGELRMIPVETRVGSTLTVALNLENLSQYEAVAGDTLFLCAVPRRDWDCSYRADIVHWKVMPAIPPGASVSDTLTFQLTPSVLGPYAVEKSRLNSYLIACFRRTPDGSSLFPGCAETASSTHFMPDLDYVCGSREIHADTVVDGETVADACRLSIGSDAEVWRFDAAAGATYTVELLQTDGPDPGLLIVDHNGGHHATPDELSFTFTTPGAMRYYIGIVQAGTYRLSLTRN